MSEAILLVPLTEDQVSLVIYALRELHRRRLAQAIEWSGESAIAAREEGQTIDHIIQIIRQSTERQYENKNQTKDKSKDS